jgi:hypothetical protein
LGILQGRLFEGEQGVRHSLKFLLEECLKLSPLCDDQSLKTA